MAEEIEEDKEAKTPKKEQEDQEKPPEEEQIEEEYPKEEYPEEMPHEEKPPEEKPIVGEHPEEAPFEEEQIEEEPFKEEPFGQEPREEEPVEGEPYKDEPPLEEPPEEEPPVEEPTKEEPPEKERYEYVSGEEQPEEEPYEELPSEEEHPEEEPPIEEPYEEEPPIEEPTEEIPPEKEWYEEEAYEEEPFKEEHYEEEPPEQEPIEEEYEYECPGCGAGISIDMSSCPGCGTELKFKEEEPFKEEPYEEELPEEEPPEEEPIEEEVVEEEYEYKCPNCGAGISIDMSSCPGCGTELKFEEEEPFEEEPPEEEYTEEEPYEEEPPKEEPPEVGPPELKEVREYDADELRKEIDRERILEKGEKSPEMLLTEIKEERRRLEEERAKLRKEMKQKEKVLKKREEKEEEEEKSTKKPKGIKSFAKERRKRKELERLRDYLFIGEYLLLVVLVMALLYAEGISFNPAYLPFENSIFLIIVFLLIFKGEKLYFRFLNMKYSGTLQRKVIGVEHYKAVELPPMMLIGFVVAVLLIPITSGIINIVIDMISFEREIIPFSSDFTFKLAMFLLASLIMSIAWVVFLIRFREKVIVPELEKIAEPFVIEDVFVITNSGLMISHEAIESKPNVDDDILSSMLTAVKEFVKDSFGSSSEEGELDELQYGKVRIIIEYGKHVYLAAVVRGQESIELRPEMKSILKGIQRKFGRVFDTWDGDLGQLKGVESMARSLINMS